MQYVFIKFLCYWNLDERIEPFIHLFVCLDTAISSDNHTYIKWPSPSSNIYILCEPW